MSYNGYDWLEQKWYNKLIWVMSDEDANIICRVKAAMDRDHSLIDKIRRDGFEGFCRWMEIHCRDIYYQIRHRLRTIWDMLLSWI